MSSKDVSVEPLKLGKKKEKQIKRNIREEHGTLIISLPKGFRKELGLKLNQNVTIERTHTNLLNWEIVIKPATLLES
jgi:hypothetical protein